MAAAAGFADMEMGQEGTVREEDEYDNVVA